MWRRDYAEVPFGNIVKHIAELYEMRKTNKAINKTDRSDVGEGGRNLACEQALLFG